MFQHSVCKLRVAYNDAFIYLLSEPRWCSAFDLFVSHNVPTFDALIRKFVCSFSYNSDNVVIRSFMNSDLCRCSQLLSGGVVYCFSFLFGF